MSRWMDEQIDGQADGMGGKMDGWMTDRCMGGWRDRWMTGGRMGSILLENNTVQIHVIYIPNKLNRNF